MGPLMGHPTNGVTIVEGFSDSEEDLQLQNYNLGRA